jgi:hypothetical protein
MNKLNILTFPQKLENNAIQLNVLLLPVDQGFDPLQPLAPSGVAFADANIQLEARIIDSLQAFPHEAAVLGNHPILDYTPSSVDKRAMFERLGEQFNVSPAYHKPPQVRPNFFTKKYLPLSYRGAFNFHRPITDDAVIDDSYHCAVKDKKGPNPAFVPDNNQVSWGKVIAYCMRHPLLSRGMGLVYETTLTLEDNWFEKGGFLYVSLGPDSDYRTELDNDPTFVKHYAARIPLLEDVTERTLFARSLFPVLLTNPPVPDGNYDSIFQEVSQFDDGFTKIVHANQPISVDPLREGDGEDENPPVYDQGVRIGWDDENTLISLNRQMRENPDNPGSGRPIDAPTGLHTYRVDVRLEGDTDWTSLVRVQSKTDLAVGTENLGSFTGELGVEVHPSQLDGYTNTSHFWLPHYFAAWNGKSMVLPDEEAADINQLPQSDMGQGSANLQRIYLPDGLNDMALYYGNHYEFRVRLSDLTGGGPELGDEPTYEAPSPIAPCHFRRYVVPEALRIADLPDVADVPYQPAGNTLQINRPLLGYPAVVYTNKYENVIDRLKEASNNALAEGQNGNVTDSTGLPDPDVMAVEIIVEIQTQKMDTVDSVSGRENFIHYYTTYRQFPVDFAETLEVPLTYQDAFTLDFSNPANPGKDILGITLQDVHDQSELPLPTGRNIRLTVRAVGEMDLEYYGHERAHIGRPIQFLLREESTNEEDLYVDDALSAQIQGIYLQPDPVPEFDGRLTSVLFGRRGKEKPADMIQRFSDQINVRHKGLTIFGAPGERLRFGCSRAIRHTLSPEHSSVTFAGKNELLNHWLVVVRIDLDRDWTWDALSDRGFEVKRTLKFQGDANPLETDKVVGDIMLMKTASRVELTNPDRDHTTLIFIDAVEPKPANDGFPDVLELSYELVPYFKDENVPSSDNWTAEISLPVTTIPAQVPKVVSAGVALSPYQHDEPYANTVPRRKYLWLEFAEPIANSQDAMFCRVLANSPDPILAKVNKPELYLAPEEPTLPIDDELIRVISPGQSDDLAGMGAMQLMEKAADSDVHYLLPLPPGMDPDSKELFGFFTYEFRVGHATVWSTAQGRYGRPFRTTGVQHPVPTLFCNVNRDDEKLYVNAPYAATVFKGKNVTADPPRTEIWCLLYAQVYQADGQEFRNILLDERALRLVDRDKIFSDPTVPVVTAVRNKDRVQVGLTGWTNTQIQFLLRRLGLPSDSPLSVLCVEMMPRLSSYIRDPRPGGVPGGPPTTHVPYGDDVAGVPVAAPDKVQPLSSQLGHYRILRTSPLTAVPAVCCC